MSIEIVAGKYSSAMFELAQEQNNVGTRGGTIRLCLASVMVDQH